MLRSALFALVLVVSAFGNAFAQNYKPFRSLRVIETARFDIIFPEESRRTAEALASFADRLYAKASTLLGISVKGRIPVAVTPDTQLFNGYMNPLPYPHIVLYDTPMDLEWGSYRDSLEGLFFHELTHAVSLSSRGPVQQGLADLFGGWVMPVALTAPQFMVEGVTVSFESLDGFGRANDPLIKQRARQALRDGAFPTPFQASGVYDLPPYGNTFYEYGGLFSAYLQKRYGMEKYGALWRAMGARFPLSFDFYKHGFAGLFRQVYGLDLRDAWADFAASLNLVGLADPGRPVDFGPGGTDKAGYDALASGGGRLWALDSEAGELRSWDPASGRSRRVIPVDAAAYDLDVSADGSLLLVSGYRFAGALATAVAVEYRSADGSRTGRAWEGLYRARYFRDGVLGLASDLHDNRLVFRGADGAERVLLKGDARLIFSAPAPIDADRFAFLAAEEGSRSLGVYDFLTGAAERLRTALPDDADRWRWARDLRASGGKLYFSYDQDDRFYKLAVLDPAAGTVAFDGVDYSGGAFKPVEAAGGLYCVGRFSARDRVLRLPVSAAAAVPVSGEAWLPRPEAAASPSAAPAAGAREEHAYHALSYLNPLKFWLPYPLIRSDGERTRLDGASIAFYVEDPTDTQALFGYVASDSAGKMADASLLWTTLGLGFPLSLKASDDLEFGASLEDARRAVRWSGTLSFTRGLRGERVQASVAPQVSGAVFAPDPGDGSTAYSWRFGRPSAWGGSTFLVSSLRQRPWMLFGEGAYAAVRPLASYPGGERRAEGLANLSFEGPLPWRLTGWGAWDESGMTVDGDSGLFGKALFLDSALAEYRADAGSGQRWVAGGEAEFRVFSVEAQTNLTHLYVNRFFGTVSWRGAAYGGSGRDLGPGEGLGGDARFVQSLVCRLGAVVSGIPMPALPLRAKPYFWAARKLSASGPDESGLALGFNFSLMY